MANPSLLPHRAAALLVLILALAHSSCELTSLPFMGSPAENPAPTTAPAKHSPSKPSTPATPSPSPSTSPAAPSPSPVLETQLGKASFYGGTFEGTKTASGEIYRQASLTAAHRTYPFGTMVRATNLNNGKSVVVRINNRGPFIQGRIIDLSRAAAEAISMTAQGVVPIRVEVLQWGD